MTMRSIKKVLTPKAFTLIELLVVISIIALLIGILVPSLATVRKKANQMKNGTQVRGIVGALIQFAQDNKTLYPGFDSNGNIVAALGGAKATTTGDGTTSSTRMALMLNDNYYSPDFMISPGAQQTTWTTGNLTTGNYSYALLQIADAVNDKGRRSEWKDTVNSEAIVIVDRNIGGDNTTGVKSDWTSDTGDWRGSVGWNDNHVTFENDHKSGINTNYAGTITTDDNIFDSGDGSTVADANSAMIYNN